LFDPNEIDRENAIWRTGEYGPGAELVRQFEVERLQALMKPFYSHGSVIDIFVLRNALEQGDCLASSRSSANLVESFLAVLGIDPRSVLFQLHALEPPVRIGRSR
jgi:hypothetical protein